MPVIKSAKKKLRKDKKLTVQNTNIRTNLKDLIKKAKKSPSEKSVKDAVKAADKAAKKHIIHKNKASRIKSTLAKLLSSNSSKTTSVAKEKVKKAPKAKKTS